MSEKWERAKVIAVDTPPDDDRIAYQGLEVTLVLEYPDGRQRFVYVKTSGWTDKRELASDEEGL